MQLSNSFEELVPKINDENFESCALELFQYQARENRVYSSYLRSLRVDPQDVDQLVKIPFMPIEFFKNNQIKTGGWTEQAIFESSGTTGSERSRNFVRDVTFYHGTSEAGYNHFYGELENLTILALLPSYLEQGNSSLISMVDYFIGQTKSTFSGYIAGEDELSEKLIQAMNGKVLLIGVAYALLDVAKKRRFDHPNLTIMETGGMKGRNKEITRSELHSALMSSFRGTAIHSEYGMTELMSQAYGEGGYFRSPPWMRILIREINDPFSYEDVGQSGGINVIDLANIHTCAFIETKDIGRVNPNGTFEVLGRMDNSDIRGCNLLMA